MWFCCFIKKPHLSALTKLQKSIILETEIWKGGTFMSHFEFDIHTHTIASGHGSAATITDMVKTARTQHLNMLGISDHGPATLGGGKSAYFRNLTYAPKNRMGIRMLYGAEVSILDNHGKLDLEDEILKHLDYVIASLHRPAKRPGSKEENTRSYIEAMKTHMYESSDIVMM